MSSSYCVAVGVLSMSLLGTSLAVQGQDVVGAKPVVSPPALRRLRNNGPTRHQADGDIWHRFAQEDTTNTDGNGTQEEEDGTEFVNLLRQTTPQYVMEQHRDVFEEMLSRAFTDISTGFNSILPPTEVPRLPGDSTATPTMQPTVLGLDAKDDAVVTTAGVPVTIAVLSNDSINGAEALPVGPLVLGTFTQPENGVVTANPDGSTLEYTPNDLYTNCPDPAVCDPVTPADCFEYQSCDQENVCVSADVCIEVTPYNGPEPVADVVSTLEGTPVTLDVLANDVSPTGEPLSLGTFTQPQNGLARLNPDGSTIEYAPNDLYTNCVDPAVCDPIIPADCFQYESCDQDAVCVWADVCVEVTPYNGPEPVVDVVSTMEGTAVTLDVLANDVSPNGEPLSVGTFTQPQNGLASLNPDGTTIEYTPNDLYTNCVDRIACDPIIPADCFQYESCDQDAVCVWADVCVEVTPYNGPEPVVDVVSTMEGTAVTLDVLANDVSPNGEPLSVGTFTQPQNGLASLNPDGTTIEYTPNDLYTNCVDRIACDPIIPADCFQYESCDQDAVCVLADVCVEVTPAIPQPEDDTAVTFEGTAVTLDVLANDVIPTGEPLSLGTFTQPQNGLARLNPDGTTIEYTPNDLYTNCVDPSSCDPVVPADCFQYESCDQDAVCVWANVCVEVTPATPQPEDDTVVTTEGTAVTLDVLANDMSPTGEPLSLGTFTQPQNGLARLNPDGTTILYSPNDLYTNCVDPSSCDPVVPADCFQYESCDQDAVCVWANVCVEVTPAAPQPEDDTVVTTEGTAVTLDVLANDAIPTGEPLSLGTFTQPQNGLARLNPDGTTIEYTPNDLYTNCVDPVACDPVVPADCFQYESCDQDAVCVWADVCVEVTPAAPQPMDDFVATTEGIEVDIDVLANDEGVDGGAVSLGTFTQPQNGLASLNPDGTTILYSPNDLYTNCPDAAVCDPVVPPDCFQYESCRIDIPSECTWATVCVEVTAAPPLPCGMSQEQRAEEILFILLDVSTPTLLSDMSTPQGQAFRWIVDEDEFYVCPSDNTCDVIQRYVLAVMYYSTNGNNWFQCSGNPAASDDCGSDFPFDAGQTRFLAPVSECDWAGIRCSENLCVTEIEFELNNLVGTIPEELGRLPLLEVLGMERGGLSSTIPSVLGQLTNLYFLDLDYNALTGTIPTELSLLTELEQLDFNDNRLTGSIDAITTLTKVFFLQLHNNAFTGTIPSGLGSFPELGAATLHSNQFTGSIAPEICALRDTVGGPLLTLSADCDPEEPNPEVVCTCCTECRDV